LKFHMFKIRCKIKVSPNCCKMGSSICSHFQLMSFEERKHIVAIVLAKIVSF
jgi:hypothetical protein